MVSQVDDGSGVSHFTRRRVVSVWHPANLANRMIQYMGALTLAERIKDCTIVNVSLPEWGIEIPDDTQNLRFFENIHSSWQRSPFGPNMEKLSEIANKTDSIKIVLFDNLHRMEFFSSPQIIMNFFHQRQLYPIR